MRKKSVTRLEKTGITKTFEKLYYDPSHYASYSAMDLTCAVKPNFCGEKSYVGSNYKTRTIHVAPTIALKISAIALQHNKH